MKKIESFFLSIMVAVLCNAQPDEDIQPIPQNDPLVKIAKNYFRSNPYSVHFSTFLNHLVNDPTLINKTIIKRTDTSLFFFKGEYTTHNPFGFKANKSEIRLVEKEIEVDSPGKKDTLLFYQLAGYIHGKEGLGAVTKECLKFDRKYGKHFYSEDTELKKEDKAAGWIRNYFNLDITAFSPVAASWADLDDFHYVFTITFRIKVVENMASLPISSDSR